MEHKSDIREGEEIESERQVDDRMRGDGKVGREMMPSTKCYTIKIFSTRKRAFSLFPHISRQQARKLWLQNSIERKGAEDSRCWEKRGFLKEMILSDDKKKRIFTSTTQFSSGSAGIEGTFFSSLQDIGNIDRRDGVTFGEPQRCVSCIALFARLNGIANSPRSCVQLRCPCGMRLLPRSCWKKPMEKRVVRIVLCAFRIRQTSIATTC